MKWKKEFWKGNDLLRFETRKLTPLLSCRSQQLIWWPLGQRHSFHFPAKWWWTDRTAERTMKNVRINSFDSKSPLKWNKHPLPTYLEKVRIVLLEVFYNFKKSLGSHYVRLDLSSLISSFLTISKMKWERIVYFKKLHFHDLWGLNSFKKSKIKLKKQFAHVVRPREIKSHHDTTRGWLLTKGHLQ